jgi:eukaryotic-like serine/threonine-protein kinase
MSPRTLLFFTTLAASSLALRADSMFRGNPAHTGVYESKSPGAMKLKWRFRSGGPIRSSAAASAGVVCFGSRDGKLYAVDASTGALRWSFETGGDVSSSPAIAAGSVYFTGGDGHIYALNLADGRKKWKFETGAEIPYFYIPGEPRTYDYWSSSPVVAGGTLYVGSRDGRVYALGLEGNLKWKTDMGSTIVASPAVADGIVYEGDMEGKLLALDAATGKVRWKAHAEGNAMFRGEFQSSPAVANGMVYVGSRDGFLYAFDAANGERKWRYDHKGAWVPTSPAVARGLVFCGSSDGEFVNAVDAKTGVEKWRWDGKTRVFSSPAVIGDRVYVGTWSGSVIALQAEDGKTAAVTGLETAVFSSPEIADGVLFIGSDDGYLYAFDAPPEIKRTEIAVDPKRLDDYPGEYQLASGMNCNISREGNGLLLDVPGQDKSPLFASDQDTFFMKAADVVLKFGRDASGKVDQMILLQGGLELKMNRVK